MAGANRPFNQNLRFAFAPFAEKSDIKPLTSQGLWAIISLCPVQGRAQAPKVEGL